MITIRQYNQDEDAVKVGILIADTYSEFNLDFASSSELPLLLGPFRHARSTDKEHRQQIARMVHSEIVLVAEDGEEIIGVLRGRKERLGSLFVRKDYHRQGVGRSLVQQFERKCIENGSTIIRVASTLFAVPFYEALGYKKSTGVRNGWSFEGQGLRIQPMKKKLGSPD
ncbi:MAG: GNAT family N-acetyltransferase [Candidatus Promineifilaceae bacterium]